MGKHFPFSFVIISLLLILLISCTRNIYQLVYYNFPIINFIWEETIFTEETCHKEYKKTFAIRDNSSISNLIITFYLLCFDFKQYE